MIASMTGFAAAALMRPAHRRHRMAVDQQVIAETLLRRRDELVERAVIGAIETLDARSGVGEAQLAGERMAAEAALARVGLAPIVLGPKEGLALLNGTQFSTAEALASLFAIERVFQAALITGDGITA